MSGPYNKFGFIKIPDRSPLASLTRAMLVAVAISGVVGAAFGVLVTLLFGR